MSKPDVSAPDAICAGLVRQAANLGFDAIGIAAAEPGPDWAQRLKHYLDEGRHGAMAWLARDPGRRADARNLWPDARSVIMLGVNYGPVGDALSNLGRPERGNVSVYARGDDYHDIVKPKLKQLARWLVATAGGDAKVFVDTAAVMEKPLAQAAGLGWQGKHSNLVSRQFGSWLFLGAIFSTLNLAQGDDAGAPAARRRAETDHCGSCRACIDACPTAAFPAPYQLDARRCISYLTIEHPGPIPREFRRAIGNRLFGCDDCLAACPWNKFARAGREARLAAREELQSPLLTDLLKLDDAAFRALFRKTPVKRTGRDRFIRNALIAAGNARDPALREDCERLLRDPSALVRGAAVWALASLVSAEEMAALAKTCGADETDDDVRDEWMLALAGDGGRKAR